LPQSADQAHRKNGAQQIRVALASELALAEVDLYNKRIGHPSDDMLKAVSIDR
jgi:hypothetical protein